MSSRKNRTRAKVLKHRAITAVKELRKEHPALFRKCGPDRTLCCQATTLQGRLCDRPAMYGSRTYFKKIKCCMLCWQHAQIYGVYGLYRALQYMIESNMSWEEYCAMNPSWCYGREVV